MKPLDHNGKTGTRLLKIALTGGAGSGKSTVSKRLKDLGLPVAHTDMFAREVVEPGSSGLAEIVATFGSSMLQKDGSLNRMALRRIITRDEASRRQLESILHPKIFERLELKVDRAVQDGWPLFFVEVPLLFEAGWRDYFDVVVLVSADDEIRIERLMARDLVSREEAQALLQIQLSDHKKIQLSDFIIRNNGSLKDLFMEIDLFLKKLPGIYKKMLKALDSQIFML